MLKRAHIILFLFFALVSPARAAEPPNRNAQLYVAVTQRDEKKVEGLLVRKASPNATKGDDPEAETALIRAADLGYDEIIQLLLDAGAEVNRVQGGGDALTKGGGRTALIAACLSNRVSTVKLLLENKAEFDFGNAETWRAWTALGASRRLDIIRLLADEADVDINAINRNDPNGRTLLMTAASRGDAETMKGLIDMGAQWSVATKDGETALTAAVLANKPEAISFLINEGMPVNQPDARDRTPLFIAAEAGKVEAAKALLAAGAQVNDLMRVVTPWYTTPLMVAAARGHKGMVRALLDAGADHTLRQKGGRTALIAAVESKKPEIVQMMLDAGADPNEKVDGRQSAMEVAVGLGERKVLDVLLKAAPKQEKPPDDINELLMNALTENTDPSNSSVEAVRAMLDQGANPNAAFDWGDTVLIFAARNGDLQTVQLLVERGAEVNRRGDKSKTALSEAVERGHAEIARFLLENGADAAFNDASGAPLLVVATRGGYVGGRQQAFTGIMELLLKKGVPVDATDGLGYTALMTAAGLGYTDAAALLLSKGAKVEAQQKNTMTPLMIAAANGRLEMVNLLLDKGANVNTRSLSEKATALIWAAKRGNTRIVQALVARGAHVNARDKSDKTALKYANEEGNTRVALILLGAGGKE
jgi:ankyrin repeat protein